MCVYIHGCMRVFMHDACTWTTPHRQRRRWPCASLWSTSFSVPGCVVIFSPPAPFSLFLFPQEFSYLLTSLSRARALSLSLSLSLSLFLSLSLSFSLFPPSSLSVSICISLSLSLFSLSFSLFLSLPPSLPLRSHSQPPCIPPPSDPGSG